MPVVLESFNACPPLGLVGSIPSSIPGAELIRHHKGEQAQYRSEESDIHGIASIGLVSNSIGAKCYAQLGLTGADPLGR